MTRMVPSPADMRDGTHRMFPYMPDWSLATNGRHYHVRCYHHQPY
jgi:hypothetical protein